MGGDNPKWCIQYPTFRVRLYTNVRLLAVAPSWLTRVKPGWVMSGAFERGSIGAVHQAFPVT